MTDGSGSQPLPLGEPLHCHRDLLCATLYANSKTSIQTPEVLEQTGPGRHLYISMTARSQCVNN